MLIGFKRQIASASLV